MSRLNPEQPIDPPDPGISGAEQRELDAAAGRGFDERDTRFREWLECELADTPSDLAALARLALRNAMSSPLWHMDSPLRAAYEGIRGRFVDECASDYSADADAEHEAAMGEPR